MVLGEKGFLARKLTDSLHARSIGCRPVGRGEIDQLSQILRPDDHVVMCAGLTPEHGRGWQTLMQNIKIAESLCAAIAKAGCAHVVCISSDAVEDLSDLYGLGHLVRERMLADVCTTLTILRPCAIYGAGDTHNSYGPNRFVRSALATGKIALFGDGEEERDHICVDDVREVVHRCLIARTTGVLPVATGRALSFRQVAQIILEALGQEIVIESLPRLKPITHRRSGAPSLKAAFPEFEPTPFETGIRKMIAELRR